MENVKILIDGIQKDVHGIFYSFESKYYFIYTEKEVDENNYVILYMTQVGRETKNTENGPVDTGYMVGIEITNPEEQQKVQTSISYIVEDKKNNTLNPLIQYLPMTMLTNLKIVGKKRFKLLKSIMIDNFKIKFEEDNAPKLENVGTLEVQPVSSNIEPLSSSSTPLDQLVVPIPEPVSVTEKVVSSAQVGQHLEELSTSSSTSAVVTEGSPSAENVIVDYRSKYFEEEEKNKELQNQIDELTKKIEEIKKVLE